MIIKFIQSHEIIFLFGYLLIGTATVIRQWRLAKAWLYGEINKT
jgi:hypothetical protein